MGQFTADLVSANRFLFGEFGETVKIRRFSGSGTSRTHADTSLSAIVTEYEPKELVGSIQQGDRKVGILANDALISLLPVTLEDGCVVRGKKLSIISIDDNTNRDGDTLLTLDLQVRG